MPWTHKAILAVVELAIYALALFPFAYSAYKHGKAGILTHIYLSIFITLRVIADGLTISDRNKPSGTSVASAVVNSIGLSPLLLATASLLDMCRLAFKQGRLTDLDKKITWIVELALQIAVVGGVAIQATGGVKVSSAKTDHELKTAHALQEAGAAILFVIWLNLCVWAGFLFLSRRRRGGGDTKTTLASRLLLFTVIALPFIGVRAVYGLVYSVDHSPDINLVTGVFAVQLVVVFLIELVAFAIMLTGLLLTKNLGRFDIMRSSSTDSTGDRMKETSQVKPY